MSDPAILIRPAVEADIPRIREIYLAVYGGGYPYKEFYDEQWLKRSIFGDDMLMLVAEDSAARDIFGTASVVFDIGAYSDLVGEFGRLAVHPDARGRGIGSMLLRKRIEAIQDRLHLGLITARVVHPYAQRIALAHDFIPVGFVPLKHTFGGQRESLALFVRYFGEALALRRNNPRIIPEVYPLATQVMRSLALPCDVVVNEDAEPYPHGGDYQLEELTAERLPSLLRIERGRVRRREIFGHMRLEYGFFKLRVGHATYLLARQDHQIAGAIGFTLDHVEHTVRVFELITSTEEAIRYLLSELERKCRTEWDVQYIEIDVSALATRMQRTLLELQFLPAAYLPAMVFHDVERLDIIRMIRLMQPDELGAVDLTPPVRDVADLVMRGFRRRSVAPRIAEAATEMPLFQALTNEQLARLASVCGTLQFKPDERIFGEQDPSDRIYLILEGTVGINVGRPAVQIGSVGRGETLGEMSLLSAGRHSATAVAETAVEAAMLTHEDLAELIRHRPDIGLHLYRNLAAGLGHKLARSDRTLRERALPHKQDDPETGSP